MADDTATGTVVLFGGHNLQGVALGDTWTWNGTTWNQIPADRRGSVRSATIMRC